MSMLPHRLIAEFGLQRWRYIASFVRGRSGKQVRERWRNQLDPCLNKDMFKPEEDEIIVSSWLKFGNREQKSPTTQSSAHCEAAAACVSCRRRDRAAVTMMIMEVCAPRANLILTCAFLRSAFQQSGLRLQDYSRGGQTTPLKTTGIRPRERRCARKSVSASSRTQKDKHANTSTLSGGLSHTTRTHADADPDLPPPCFHSRAEFYASAACCDSAI